MQRNMQQELNEVDISVNNKCFSDMTFARSNNKDLDHVGTHVLTNLNAMKTDGLSLTKCYMFFGISAEHMLA